MCFMNPKDTFSYPIHHIWSISRDCKFSYIHVTCQVFVFFHGKLHFLPLSWKKTTNLTCDIDVGELKVSGYGPNIMTRVWKSIFRIHRTHFCNLECWNNICCFWKKKFENFAFLVNFCKFWDLKILRSDFLSLSVSHYVINKCW